jgi:GNAT superfamily N-acetyltransferase
MANYVTRLAETGKAADCEIIARLHRKSFGESCPFPWLSGWWWIVEYDGKPVAFAGLQETREGGSGYLCRTGVIPSHRGQGLQKKMIRIRERKALSRGWKRICTDTTGNPISANNLIACGYRTFLPKTPWGPEPSTIYWVRSMGDG